MLKVGDKVGLISCSDGVSRECSVEIEGLIAILRGFGLEIKLAKTIYRNNTGFSGNAEDRAKELMKMFEDDEIRAIFDLSGGDSANQILDYLEFDKIRDNNKMYFGMSDLSVVLNSIYKKSGIRTCHFYIRNLVNTKNKKLINDFYNTIFSGKDDLFDIKYNFIRGNCMEGVVIGGNIRCFLKLMGTDYLPKSSNKILLLESLGGNETRIASLLTQLKQSSYLDNINGIILGNFRHMQDNNFKPTVEELVLEITKEKSIPIIKTDDIGHISEAKAILIGVHRKFK